VEHTEALAEAGHLPAPVSTKPKTAAQKVADKIKAIIPTDKPVEDDLDSIYEGRASTPKSSKQTKTKPRRVKKGKSKS